MKNFEITYSLPFHLAIRILLLLLLVFTPHLSDAQFGPQNIITACEACEALSVYATDLDGDGDMDVLSASENDNKIAWYENLNIMAAASQEESAKHFDIYPNPTRGEVNLTFQNIIDGNYIISLIDVFGRAVYSSTTKISSVGKFTLDWSQLAEGSYLLTVLFHVKQGMVYTEKVVIQR